MRKAACSVDPRRGDVLLLLHLLAILIIVHFFIGHPLSSHIDHLWLTTVAILVQHLVKLIRLLCLLRDAKRHIRRLLMMQLLSLVQVTTFHELLNKVQLTTIIEVNITPIGWRIAIVVNFLTVIIIVFQLLVRFVSCMFLAMPASVVTLAVLLRKIHRLSFVVVSRRFDAGVGVKPLVGLLFIFAQIDTFVHNAFDI